MTKHDLPEFISCENLDNVQDFRCNVTKQSLDELAAVAIENGLGWKEAGRMVLEIGLAALAQAEGR